MYVSIYLSTYLSICLLSIYLSVYLFTYRSIYLTLSFIYLPIYLSVCLSIYLSGQNFIFPTTNFQIVSFAHLTQLACIHVTQISLMLPFGGWWGCLLLYRFYSWILPLTPPLNLMRKILKLPDSWSSRIAGCRSRHFYSAKSNPCTVTAHCSTLTALDTFTASGHFYSVRALALLQR